MIDLHTHTNASDGTLSLEELVREAGRAGLKAVAVTDHDTLASAKMIVESKRAQLELIPGIELTVYDDELGYEDIHVLGLFIDPHNPALSRALEELGRERESQKMATVERLRGLGYSITFDEVRAEARGAIGRPHIAKVLLRRYPDEFDSISMVFVKLLGRGKKAYLPRERGIGFREAASLLHGAGGLAVLAHPDVYPYDPRKMLVDFKSAGGDGVEVHYDYIRNRPEIPITAKENSMLIEKYHGLAEELGLLESGGSDFHGATKGQKLGESGAPDRLLPPLRAALGKPL
jgi:predicted metal-dependent phosphoesterase TrpH